MYTLSQRHVKAVRKARVCEWCASLIPKGEPAEYRATVYDGFQTSYMHPECDAAMLEVASDDGGALEWWPGDYARGSAESF